MRLTQRRCKDPNVDTQFYVLEVVSSKYPNPNWYGPYTTKGQAEFVAKKRSKYAGHKDAKYQIHSFKSYHLQCWYS